MNPENSEDNASTAVKVSRRKLLQLLAASGMVVGLDYLLPGSWVKPVAAQGNGLEGCQLPEGCDINNFPLMVQSLGATIVPPSGGNPDPGNGNPVQWQVNFAFHDPAGLINSDVKLTAVAINSNTQTIYNGTSLVSQANGALQNTSMVAYIPQCSVKSESVYNVSGTGSFQFYLQQPGANARTAPEIYRTLNWSLQDLCARTSNIVTTDLKNTPTATSLADLVVQESDSGKKAAGAAAIGIAAAGAATVKALKPSADEQAEQGSKNA